MRLQNLLEIKTGYSIRGKIEPVPKHNGDLQLLQMKNLDPTLGVNGDLAYIKFQGKKAPEFLEKNDILFVGRGIRFFAVCLDQDMAETAAAPQLLVLKLRGDMSDKALPQFITWYINSRQAQSFLHREATGTAVTHISKSSLEKMPIKLPDLSRQEQIVKLHELSVREKQITEQLLNKKEKLIEHILSENI